MDSPFQPLVQPFIDYLKFEKRYSPHTVRSYQDDLCQFFLFLNKSFGDIPVKDIIPAYVRSWLASLKEENLTARSINRKLSTLKSFFKYQVRTGELEQTPMTNVIAPKAGKRLPSFIPETDLAALLHTLRFSEDWKGLNAKMLLSLFYFTGMRLSELINLKERQIDKSKRVIKILGKGNKERIVPVSPELLKMIDEYIDAKKKEYELTDEYLLVTEKGKRMYPKYAYLLTRHYLSTIKTLEKKSPHTLRHTFATHLTNHGANLNAVKELLGHASLASTQVYTHNTIEKLKEVYKKAHPKEQK
jgi:integrase/recombinase XerC